MKEDAAKEAEKERADMLADFQKILREERENDKAKADAQMNANKEFFRAAFVKEQTELAAERSRLEAETAKERTELAAERNRLELLQHGARLSLNAQK